MEMIHPGFFVDAATTLSEEGNVHDVGISFYGFQMRLHIEELRMFA